MPEPAVILLTLGMILLLGLGADALGRVTHVPRVTLLLLLGVGIGPDGLDVLPVGHRNWFPLITDVALAMVGFLLGEKLTVAALRKHGRQVAWLSVGTVLGTAVCVGVGLWLVGLPLEVALLMAGIAPATDPAATIDVVEESDADGPFTETLLGIVAVDDAWGVMLFAALLAVATVVSGEGGAAPVLLHAVWELGGALLLGLILGVPVAYLSGRVKPGEPTLLEALGVVLLVAGVALWWEVSYLLAAMFLGATVANLSKHHTRPFHAIHEIDRVFLTLFFVLAGSSLELSALSTIGVAGAAYVGLRILGRLSGACAAGRLAKVKPPVARWMGPALLPQAGVAMGLALLAKERLPDAGGTLLSLALTSTVLFELIGPPSTRLALARVGESGSSGSKSPGIDDT